MLETSMVLIMMYIGNNYSADTAVPGPNEASTNMKREQFDEVNTSK
jgi:hypothetical protein